jgi:hypothetical protein
MSSQADIIIEALKAAAEKYYAARDAEMTRLADHYSAHGEGTYAAIGDYAQVPVNAVNAILHSDTLLFA